MNSIEISNEENKRPSWDEYFKNIVQFTKQRSPCHRLQVGCLFVRDNRIISQAYNGFISGAPHKSIMMDGHEQATIHAEQNAIIDCAKRGVSCDGCTVYITHFPCFICSKMMVASGIKEIKYIEDYRNTELSLEFLKMKNVSIEKI